MKYAIGVLLLVGCCVAQTRVIPITDHPNTVCVERAKEVAGVVGALKERPSAWRIYAVCTDIEYNTLRRKASVKNSAAYSDIKTGTTWLNMGTNLDRFSELPAVLKHEAEHLNCKCRLSEN